MNQEPQFTTDSRVSINVRAIVLPRAGWEHEYINGQLAVKPVRGTWYGHVFRGKSAHDVTVIPMIGCPNCGGLTLLCHLYDTQKAIAQLMSIRFPVVHKIDHLGRVSPDLTCKHGSCDLHRKVILDKWLKTKPLFAIAYVENDSDIKIDYAHAIDKKEALAQWAPQLKKNCRVIDAGPAVGFYVDEKTGRITAD